MKTWRKSQGQSLVETTTAFLVLIPIGLAGVDVATAVSASHQNEQLAEMAARASAGHPDLQSAQIAAQDAVDRYAIGPVIESVTLGNVDYNAGEGTVGVETIMRIKLPVPVPYFSDFTCRASAIQPLVALPPPT